MAPKKSHPNFCSHPHPTQTQPAQGAGLGLIFGLTPRKTGAKIFSQTAFRSTVGGRRSTVDGRRSTVGGRRSAFDGRRSAVAGRRSKVFPRFPAEADPRDPPRSPGPAPHINFDERSAPQTNSKAVSRHPANPARPPSGTQFRKQTLRSARFF